jgi:hypothetical protein
MSSTERLISPLDFGHCLLALALILATSLDEDFGVWESLHFPLLFFFVSLNMC